MHTPSVFNEILTSCYHYLHFPFQAKIVDDKGRVVPVNTAGEICFRGYNVMLGYWEDKEKTDACIEPSGWFHSGLVHHVNISDKETKILV